MVNYTLVAYKEEGYNTCRGCVTDTSSSNFQLICTSSSDELTSRWAELVYADTIDDGFIPDWDITILINGDHADWEPIEELRSIVCEKIEELKQQAHQKLLAEKLAKEQKNLKLAEDKRLADEEKDRLEFERLKVKFGDG